MKKRGKTKSQLNIEKVKKKHNIEEDDEANKNTLIHFFPPTE